MKIASARRLVRLLSQVCQAMPEHCGDIVAEIQLSRKLLRAAELEGIEIVGESMVDRTASVSQAPRGERQQAGAAAGRRNKKQSSAATR